MNKDSGVTSKLNALLRLGLVSKNNVRRAIYVFQNPEQAMKQAQNRTLMQELLIDVVDRIINNKSLYAMVRQNLTKDAHTSEASVTEDVSDERTKTLLRSGLVKKKDIVVARRALSSKSNMKQMAAVGAYRELMIDMLDSMAKKITGNPALFNAFKRTMGNSQADESFTSPNMETILEFGLDQDAAELLESYKPSDSKLWTMAKKQARGMFESNTACQNAWAMKWYNEQDGAWTAISEGKTFTKFMRSLEEGDKVLSPKQKKLDINKNKRLDAEDFKALRKEEIELDEGDFATDMRNSMLPRNALQGFVPQRLKPPLKPQSVVSAKDKAIIDAILRPAKRTNKPVKEEIELDEGKIKNFLKTAAVVGGMAALGAGVAGIKGTQHARRLGIQPTVARHVVTSGLGAAVGAGAGGLMATTMVPSRPLRLDRRKKANKPVKEEVDTTKPAAQTPEQAEQARRAAVVARAKKLARAAMAAAAQANTPVKEGTEAKMGRVMDAETKAHEQGNLPKRERLTRIKRKLDDGLVKKWQRRGGSINPGVFLNAAAKKRKAALALKNKGKA